MSSNASDNAAPVNAASPPTNLPSTPEPQTAFEERRAELKKILRRKKKHISRQDSKFADLQARIVRAEKVTPVDPATIEKLTKEFVELQMYINGIIGIHNVFVRKYQRLIDERTGTLRGELFDEMRVMMIEADSDGGGEDDDGEAVCEEARAFQVVPVDGDVL